MKITPRNLDFHLRAARRTAAQLGILLAAVLGVGCMHRPASAPALHAKATGSAIVIVSGDRQLGSPGSLLPQSLVLQVNDDQGNAVPGAVLQLAGPAGVTIRPAQALTDDNGQVTVRLTLGGISGLYPFTATSPDAHGKTVSLLIPEYAAGYQQQVGFQVNATYCSRCHDSNSTVEQVSNYDNLAVKPHAFTSGDIYNKLSQSDLSNIITHGGVAVNRSALMPAYGWTLSKPEIEAVIAYIRLISDPPYRAPGLVYDKH